MFTKKIPPHLHRVVATAVFGAVLSTSWDIWWHYAIGRDTPWEPPHFFIAICGLVALGCSVYGWRRTRSRLWRRLCIPLGLLPLVVVWDQVWHQIFGAEDLSTALIILSPPHASLALCMALSAMCVLSLLHHDPNPRAQEFFGSLMFSCLIALAMTYPLLFHPSFGFALLGFWGAAIMAAVYVAVTISAADWKETFAGGTLSMMVFLILYNIAFGAGEVSIRVITPSHGHTPIWLVAFAYLLPAAIIDVWKDRPLWLRGMVAGGLFGLLLFGFAPFFFDPLYWYGLRETFIAVASCFLGGAAGGALLEYLRGHLPKYLVH